MLTLRVDNLRFVFKKGVKAEIYEDWVHYQTAWQSKDGGKKAVDVIAIEISEAPETAWFIEAKDFRIITNPPKRSNAFGLPRTVKLKVIDTLDGLSDAAQHSSEESEKEFAAFALSAPVKRVVLHLEPHIGSYSYLFPRNFAASVLQRLRQELKGNSAKVTLSERGRRAQFRYVTG